MPSDTQHTPELVLIARIEEKTPDHAVIGVFQNGGKAGVLIVDAEQAEQLVGILNAGTDLLAACEGLNDYLAQLRDLMPTLDLDHLHESWGDWKEIDKEMTRLINTSRAAIAKAQPEPRKDDTDARTLTTQG